MLNLQKGEEFIITREGEVHGFGPMGGKASVVTVISDNHLPIGLLFEEESRKDLHDLSGRIAFNRGYWVSEKELLHSNFFMSVKKNIVINKGVEFGNKDLSNKPGRIIKQFAGSKHFMVELEENIGGYCGDGMGKRGHCIMVEKDKINFKKIGGKNYDTEKEMGRDLSK
jgi:hypothetical protein